MDKMQWKEEMVFQRECALKKIQTPEKCQAAKIFIEENVIKNFRRKQPVWWNATVNYFVITFYQVGDNRFAYNTNVAYGYEYGSPQISSSNSVIAVAVSMAEDYGIEAYEFPFGSDIAYRFKAKI